MSYSNDAAGIVFHVDGGVSVRLLPELICDEDYMLRWIDEALEAVARFERNNRKYL